MRSICSIILLISLSAADAGEKGPDAIIWYDGSTFYKPLDRKKSATIYFSQWEQSIYQFINDKNYRVALQLDHRLDPNLDDKVSLPDLNQLSAISDGSVVAEYLTFLENYSRTLGFNHLVLPDTIKLGTFQKEVIQTAIELSPFFFLPRSYISDELPSSKKEIQTDHPMVWVSSQSFNSKKLNKLESIYSKEFRQILL